MVLIPKGTFFLNPILLKGPCKDQTKFTIQGDLKAPIENQFSVDIEYWINFQYVNQLVIDGGGSLDGQGPTAWPYNKKKLPTVSSSCPTNLHYIISFSFAECDNIVLVLILCFCFNYLTFLFFRHCVWILSPIHK